MSDAEDFDKDTNHNEEFDDERKASRTTLRLNAC